MSPHKTAGVEVKTKRWRENVTTLFVMANYFILTIMVCICLLVCMCVVVTGRVYVTGQ